MTTKKEKNYFEELISIDVSKEIEKKQGPRGKTLSYASATR